MDYEDMPLNDLKEEIYIQRYARRMYRRARLIAEDKIRCADYKLNQNPEDAKSEFWRKKWIRRKEWAEGKEHEADANVNYLQELVVLCSNPKQKKRKAMRTYKRKHTGHYDPRRRTTPWNQPKYKNAEEFKKKELEE